ncbi:MAG: hypothetical protein DRP95_07025 [Candidatus Latescibacterota bacterium]|nr:MAG: hypothetical protein DRP95_07025 [Candidatus Latescibacterota bacterium]
MYTRLLFAILFMGATAISGQIVLLRELMVAFYGNELSLGVMLSAWLAWGAVGSWVLGRWADRIRDKVRALAFLQIGIWAILPLELFLARTVRKLMGMPPGELTGMASVAVAAFGILAPICIAGGFGFTLGCRMFSERYGSALKGIGNVYILEAAGSGVGGLLTQLLLIYLLPPFGLAVLIGGLNVFSALSLCWEGHKLLRGFCTLGLLGTGTAVALGGVRAAERLSSEIRWQGMELVHTENSPYGRIALVRMEGEYSLFENGILMSTSKSRLSVEERVHFPMLVHPKPERVLMIGGGLGGGLTEVLKHPVREVDYLELDPAVVHVWKQFVQQDIFRDPRLRVIYEDGRRWVRRHGKLYDVVIVGLSDPLTAQLNRFYTAEFFGDVKAHIRPGGVFSFGVTSSENVLGDPQRRYLACLFRTLKGAFREVRLIPGETAYFLASDVPISLDPALLVERLTGRGIKARFVREYYLPYKLSPDRMEYIREKVVKEEDVRPNRDFFPVGYFYALALWASQFYHRAQGFLINAGRIGFRGALVPIGAYFLVGLILTLRSRPSWRAPVVMAIGTTGLAEMAFQTVVLMAFQAKFGYVYYKLGLILSMFMVGLSLGSWAVVRWGGQIRSLHAFIWTQVGVVAYPLVLASLLGVIRGEAAFAALPVLAGFVGGVQFPLAGRLTAGEAVGREAGRLYGVDLLGAFFGAVGSSILLMPLLGIRGALYWLSILNGATLTFLLLGFLRPSAS